MSVKVVEVWRMVGLVVPIQLLASMERGNNVSSSRSYEVPLPHIRAVTSLYVPPSFHSRFKQMLVITHLYQIDVPFLPKQDSATSTAYPLNSSTCVCTNRD